MAEILKSTSEEEYTELIPLIKGKRRGSDSFCTEKRKDDGGAELNTKGRERDFDVGFEYWFRICWLCMNSTQVLIHLTKV